VLPSLRVGLQKFQQTFLKRMWKFPGSHSSKRLASTPHLRRGKTKERFPEFVLEPVLSSCLSRVMDVSNRLLLLFFVSFFLLAAPLRTVRSVSTERCAGPGCFSRKTEVQNLVSPIQPSPPPLRRAAQVPDLMTSLFSLERGVAGSNVVQGSGLESLGATKSNKKSRAKASLRSALQGTGLK
jgi:hypothetical protein